MYAFNVSLVTIATRVRKAVKSDEATAVLIFDMYRGSEFRNGAPIGNPVGTLTITVEENERFEEDKAITVCANTYRDPNRANQITARSSHAADLLFAIGFTCGSAFWREPER